MGSGSTFRGGRKRMARQYGIVGAPSGVGATLYDVHGTGPSPGLRRE